MLNWLFFILVAGAVVTAAFTGKMFQIQEASALSAKTAVELAIGLIGQMALWLGFMAILREAGVMAAMARALAPIMKRLFPEVPPEHPAMGAMIMNIAANAVGLGNAATPFGLKAMAELNKLNKQKGVATNAMALFLVINTSGVAVLPLGVVATRSLLKSTDPGGIIIPSLIGTFVSTVLAVLICKAFELPKYFAVERYASATPEPEAAPAAVVKAPDATALAEAEKIAEQAPRANSYGRTLYVGVTALIGVAMILYFRSAYPEVGMKGLAKGLVGDWLLPLLMLFIVTLGLGRRVKIYEVFVAAAKEGSQVGLMIIPFLVAILVAIGVFRASGAMEAITGVLGPYTALVGFPAEALPMALIRPMSGTGATGVMIETMNKYGPDSFIGYLVSLINGSSETTFYILALYFGSVQVRAIRHTLIACLTSDMVSLAIAVALCHVFFG